MHISTKITAVVFFIIALIFLVFFVFQNEETSVYMSKDYSVQKKVSFNALLNIRNEKYTIYAQNPVVGYLVVPKNIAVDASAVGVKGEDFDVIVLKKDPVLKLVQDNLAPGTNVVEVSLPLGNKDETTQLYLLPMSEALQSPELMKEFDKGIEVLSENAAFSVYGSDKAMEYYFSALDGGKNYAQALIEATTASKENEVVSAIWTDNNRGAKVVLFIEKEKVNFISGETLKITVLSEKELVEGEMQIINPFSKETVYRQPIAVKEKTNFIFNGKINGVYIDEGEWEARVVFGKQSSNAVRFVVNYGKKELEKNLDELKKEFAFSGKEVIALSALKDYVAKLPIFTETSLSDRKIGLEKAVLSGNEPLEVKKTSECIYLYYPKDGEKVFANASLEVKRAISYFKENPINKQNIFERECEKIEQKYGLESINALQANGVIARYFVLLKLQISAKQVPYDGPDRIAFDLDYAEFGERITRGFDAEVIKPSIELESGYLEYSKESRGFTPKSITPMDNIVCYIDNNYLDANKNYVARIITTDKNKVTPFVGHSSNYNSGKYKVFEFLGFNGFREKDGYGWTEDYKTLRKMLLDKKAVCEISAEDDNLVTAKTGISLNPCFHFWGKEDGNLDVLFLSRYWESSEYAVVPRDILNAAALTYIYGFNDVSPFKENIGEVLMYVDLLNFDVGTIHESPTDEEWEKIKNASSCGKHNYTVNLLDGLALSTATSRMGQNAANIGYNKEKLKTELDMNLFGKIVLHEIGGHVVGKLLDEYEAKGIKLREDKGYEKIATNCVPYKETSLWSEYVTSVSEGCSMYTRYSGSELRYRPPKESLMNTGWYFNKKLEEAKFNLISCAYVLAGIRTKGGITLESLGAQPFLNVEKYIPECKEMALRGNVIQ